MFRATATGAGGNGEDMQFRDTEYYLASLERMRQARELSEEEGNWALVMYCAGVAVECMLRAFRWMESASFEGRHDLRELLKASRLLQIDGEYMRKRGADDDKIVESGRRLRAAMNEVALLWHNNLGFASETKARTHLKELKRDRGVKGDFLAKNAKDLLEAAQIVINQGITLWTSKGGSKKR